MTTEPTVGPQAYVPAQAETGKKGLIITLGVLVLLAIGITYFWMYGMKHAPTMPQPFVLYENEAYQWYLLSGNQISVIDMPTDVAAGVATYPGGGKLSITEKGLEWTQAEGESTYVLVDRTGLTPETSFISLDGTLAVLFNQVTNQYDVFSVTYEGAYVSYIASILLPVFPAYPIAGAAVGGSTIIMHTGAPDTYQIYKVGDTTVTQTGTATMVASAPAVQ